jgi:outer membrane protein, multidrug efflux system
MQCNQRYKNSVSKWVFVLALGFVVSCAVPKPAAEPPARTLPQYFMAPTDTASIALISRGRFFEDSLLLALIDTALANNLEVKMALQRVEQRRADLVRARGYRSPVVDFTAGAAVRKFGLYTMDGAGNSTTDIQPGKTVPEYLPDYVVGFQSQWEVDLWGKIKNQQSAAAERVLASSYGQQWVRTQLVSEVARSYVELQALDREMALTKDFIALQSKALDLAKVQKQAARVTELAVKQFESLLLNLQSYAEVLKGKIADEEAQLNLLCGRYPQPIRRSNLLPGAAFADTIRVGIPSDLLKRRPDIQEAFAALTAQGLDRQAAQKAFYPSLRLSANLGYQAFQTGLLFLTPESVALGVLGGLSAPLLNRQSLQANFKMANAIETELLLSYQKTVLTAFKEVYAGMAMELALQKSITQKAAEAQAVSDGVKIAEELYRAGRANYVEVILVQENALKARSELIAAEKARALQAILLYRALGGN